MSDEFEAFIALLKKCHYREAGLRLGQSMPLDTDAGMTLIDALALNPYVSELYFSRQADLWSFFDRLLEKLAVRKLSLSNKDYITPPTIPLLEKLTTYQTLTELHLHGMNLPKSCIDILAACSALRTLSLADEHFQASGTSETNFFYLAEPPHSPNAISRDYTLDFKPLLEHRNLTYLDLSQFYPSRLTVAELFISKSLRTLQFEELYELSETDYQQVLGGRDNPILESLRYGGRSHAANDYAKELRYNFLEKLSNLQEFHISARLQAEAEMRYYSEKLKLKKLVLNRTPIPGEQTGPYVPAFEDYTARLLAQNHYLENIYLHGHNLSRESLACLLSNTKAQHLKLCPYASPYRWYKMTDLPSSSITNLDIRDCRYNQGMYEDLCQFVNLRQLKIDESEPNPSLFSGAKRFFALPHSLESLDFSSNLHSPTEIATIAQLPHLTRLKFEASKPAASFGDLEAALFSRMAKLTEIEVWRGHVTEIGARALLDNPRLIMIHLPGHPCTQTYHEFMHRDSRVVFEREDHHFKINKSNKVQTTPNSFRHLIQFTKKTQAERNAQRRTLAEASHPKAGKNSAAARLFAEYPQPDLLHKIFSWLT